MDEEDLDFIDCSSSDTNNSIADSVSSYIQIRSKPCT